MITLVTKGAESRADTRLIAQSLGNQHENVMQLVKTYRADFEEFGILRFETGEIQGRGQPERFALLNEDQAFFLLALSRNTRRVVSLKSKLVQAFKDARLRLELHAEYLPGYHEMHEHIHALANGSPNERWTHANLNKLVNKTAGIASGQRGVADTPRKALLITAQHLVLQAMRGASDHHEGYARAKTALEPLSNNRIAQ